MQQHLKAMPPYKKVAVKTYMKPDMMSSQFSTRRGGGGCSAVDRSSVVHSFNCSDVAVVSPIMSIRLISYVLGLKRSLTLKEVSINISQ